ncbi:MAG: sodium:alanine symporter family protein [Oscillospiraceae bacterium]|nr:sodium:alanine symporter family protein [Oscillospiraceae bacterium]
MESNVYEKFGDMLKSIDNFVWGIPLIVLIILTGIYLTVRVRGLQVRHLGRALKYMVKNEEGGEGEVSSFGALCTALSATIGTGNIVGVATAIAAGGPGALFWMIVAAFFGMATKYSEGFLAIKYRTIDEDGHVLGGPFYYIENGMGKKWKWLAKIFAFFGVCVGLMGIGTFTQVNGISSAVTNFFDPMETWTVYLFGRDISWVVVIAGLVITAATALVIIGGIKRIAKVSEVVVPFMAVLYVVFALLLVICNITEIPAAVVQVVRGAFGFGDAVSGIRAVAGGILGAMMAAMQNGVARGIFSNEAGLGSAPIAAAAAKTKEPVRQGLVSMTGTFIDTIVICTMTGLSIVIAGSWAKEGLEGVAITTDAFCSGLPFPSAVSSFVLMICLTFFAFTTILGWDYYSERCLEYLSNKNKTVVKVYRWLYVLAVFIGPYLTVAAVWTIADIFNGLMAIPNVIALIALSGVIAKETKEYFENCKK